MAGRTAAAQFPESLSHLDGKVVVADKKGTSVAKHTLVCAGSFRLTEPTWSKSNNLLSIKRGPADFTAAWRRVDVMTFFWNCA